MFPKIRDRIHEKVNNLEYVMTIHAEEEMVNDNLSIFDVEIGILNGEITERQKDSETGEWKYLIDGKTIDDDSIVVVVKLSETGKLVIITVYKEDYGLEN